ncbi:hypothetical protein DY000_02013474 [Brassica cretica]|uniref:Uncharacterized protein n=1 Tax=Brassica cretica TaxID=69181 RepID=A0ABQ7D0Z1_BRACR|nr:hypothetical protein DY000_02013474 [Brassica cretica]
MGKDSASEIPGPSDTMGKDSSSEIPCPSATMGKDQDKSSRSLCPAATKEKGKGKVDESLVPPTVRRSPRQGRKNLSQSSTHGEPSPKKEEMGTKEYLQDALGNLSQILHKVSIPHKKTSDEEAPKWVTPLSSFKTGDWRTPTLKDMELPEDRVNDEDYSLVFFPEDSWAKLIHWHLKIVPSMYTTELAERVMGPAVWLNNHEIDAMLFLFRERTSLRRWNPSKVAFMSCIFSNQMKNSYIEFKKDRKKIQGRRTAPLEIETETDDMMDFLKNLSQSSTHGEPSSKKEEMGTQEYLQDALGNLHMLKVSIPHKKMSDEEAPKWVTPLSSFKPGDWRTPTLKDMELPEDRVNDEDYSLVFVPEDSWAKLIH